MKAAQTRGARLFAAFVGAWLAFTATTRTANAEHSRDGGRLRGTVTAVDYQKNEIALKIRGAREARIFVAPSTPVVSLGGSDYHGISDIRVGSRLEVEVSSRGRDYDAQTIEIRPGR